MLLYGVTVYSIDEETIKEEDISKKDREIIKKVIFKGTNFESKLRMRY